MKENEAETISLIKKYDVSSLNTTQYNRLTKKITMVIYNKQQEENIIKQGRKETTKKTKTTTKTS